MTERHPDERMKPTLTCPLCREVLDDEADVTTCFGCATEFHTACAVELGGGTCPTLGCGASVGESVGDSGGETIAPPATRPTPQDAGALARSKKRFALLAGLSALGAALVVYAKSLSVDPLSGPTELGPLFGALFGLFMILAVITVVLHQFAVVTCGPDEAVVLSGMSRTDPMTGSLVGYRVLLPDDPSVPKTAVRIPFLEARSSLDLRPIDVAFRVKGVFFKGGERLDLQVKATVSISRTPEILVNAIERFLGQGRQEIADVAAATLEGHLRAQCASTSPDEKAPVERIVSSVKASAPEDLRKLGIELRSLLVGKPV